MWRIGVLVLAVLVEITSADVKTGVHHELAQRYKRSPERLDCEPVGLRHPPPPPFWPPPPPPPFWRHHHHHHPPPWEYRQQPEFPQQPKFPPHPEFTNVNNTKNENEKIEEKQKEPCKTCGGNGNTAISNAKSDSGQAIAVAISRDSGH